MATELDAGRACPPCVGDCMKPKGRCPEGSFPAWKPADGVMGREGALRAGLSGVAFSAATKQCFDCYSACADVSPTRCTLCPNRKAVAGVTVLDRQTPRKDAT